MPSPPGVTARVRDRITIATLRRPGVAVYLELPGAQTVSAVLRTDDLARVPGKRGSTARPKTVTLARTAPKRGKQMKLMLRIPPRTGARLRARRAVTGRVTIVAKRDDGAMTVLEHRVRIVRGAPKKKRSPRRRSR